MINAIPVIGWLISFVLSVALAVPFSICWNALAPTYFYWLPPVYQHIPFWHCVGLFIILPILKRMLVPTLMSSSSESSSKGN